MASWHLDHGRAFIFRDLFHVEEISLVIVADHFHRAVHTSSTARPKRFSNLRMTVWMMAKGHFAQCFQMLIVMDAFKQIDLGDGFQMELLEDVDQ